ncbi:MAG: cyclic nucleotide-binding domain-containing protein [Proteobacteria bacterium]|nr:cyclic nucleotide-binding domain-containing protein [Pseudomonadota bacterium]
MFKTYVADTDDVRKSLYRFRYDVFVSEQKKYRNIADHEGRMLIDPVDEHATHLCLERDGQIIGSMRFLHGLEHVPPAWHVNLALEKFAQFPASHFAFSGRLLMLPAYRGSRGLLDLIRFAYQLGRSAGSRFDFISCNPHLVRFYEMMGYRRYCAYYEAPGLGFQVPMVLVTDDIPHLQGIGSPFTSLANDFPIDSSHGKWFVDTFPQYQHFISPVTIGPSAFAEVLERKINDASISLFDGLEPTEIATFLSTATHLEVPAQTRIVQQGQLGEEMFLILEGIAEVRRHLENGRAQVLGTMGRGDVFGEMAVITERPRSADVVAQSPLEVAFIDRSSLLKLVKGEPAVASKLLFNLCRLLSERIEMREASVS